MPSKPIYRPKEKDFIDNETWKFNVILANLTWDCLFQISYGSLLKRLERPSYLKGNNLQFPNLSGKNVVKSQVFLYGSYPVIEEITETNIFVSKEDKKSISFITLKDYEYSDPVESMLNDIVRLKYKYPLAQIQTQWNFANTWVYSLFNGIDYDNTLKIFNSNQTNNKFFSREEFKEKLKQGDTIKFTYEKHIAFPLSSDLIKFNRKKVKLIVRLKYDCMAYLHQGDTHRPYIVMFLDDNNGEGYKCKADFYLNYGGDSMVFSKRQLSNSKKLPKFSETITIPV